MGKMGKKTNQAASAPIVVAEEGDLFPASKRAKLSQQDEQLKDGEVVPKDGEDRREEAAELMQGATFMSDPSFDEEDLMPLVNLRNSESTTPSFTNTAGPNNVPSSDGEETDTEEQQEQQGKPTSAQVQNQRRAQSETPCMDQQAWKDSIAARFDADWYPMEWLVFMVCGPPAGAHMWARFQSGNTRLRKLGKPVAVELAKPSVSIAPRNPAFCASASRLPALDSVQVHVNVENEDAQRAQTVEEPVLSPPSPTPEDPNLIAQKAAALVDELTRAANLLTRTNQLLDQSTTWNRKKKLLDMLELRLSRTSVEGEVRRKLEMQWDRLFAALMHGAGDI